MQQLTSPLKVLMLVALLTCNCFSNVLEAQKSEPSTSSRESLALFYKQKAKTQNTFGFIALGSGLGLAGYSILNYAHIGYNGPWKHESLFIKGSLVALSSSVFFLSACGNKRKARLVLKGEQLSSGHMFSSPVYSAVALRVRL